jgi:hypothetical protein
VQLIAQTLFGLEDAKFLITLSMMALGSYRFSRTAFCHALSSILILSFLWYAL